MGNIAIPVQRLIERIRFHRDTGYPSPTNPASIVRLLKGVKFYELPTARADDVEDLPHLTMHVPKFTEVTEGGRNQAQLAIIEVTFDFASKQEWGLYHASELGFMNLAEIVLGALTRNAHGHPDRWLEQSVSNQIAIAVSDGVASGQSITASAVVTLKSKLYQ